MKSTWSSSGGGSGSGSSSKRWKVGIIVAAVVLVILAIAGVIAGGEEESVESVSASTNEARTSANESGGTSTQETTSEPEHTDLEINSHADGDTVRARTVVLRSEATPNATVTVAGEEAQASDSGRWAIRVPLKKVGESSLVVEATAPGRDETRTRISVVRERTARERAAIRRRRAEAEARREAAFRAEAQTIPYNQLAKNPERYVGERVVYRGQIFQIQEAGGVGFMLLSVTDEGYGFWDDNVWINYEGTIDSAEDDIVTVYGTVVGQKTYETQIGGETFVPEIDAEFIDE